MQFSDVREEAVGSCGQCLRKCDGKHIVTLCTEKIAPGSSHDKKYPAVIKNTNGRFASRDANEKVGYFLRRQGVEM